MSEKNIAAVKFSERMEEQLNEFISKLIQKRKIPGISLTIVDKENVLLSRGYGYKNVEELIPATENTLYPIGSVTKSFTALSIIQLQEKGLINIHDPVTKYVPSFKVDGYADKTEIYHMLTHSSGFPTLNVAEILLLRNIGKDSSYIPMSDFHDFIDFLNEARDERVTPPGKSFFYWNEGYTILGKIIEEVTNEKFENYVKKHILEPLEMKSSGFLDDLEWEDDIATPYYFDKDQNREPVAIPNQYLVQAAGGLISSSLELSKYLRMWIGSKEFSEKIVKKESLLECVKPRIKSGRFGQFGEAFYGYGWLVNTDFFGKTLVSHSGSVGVSSGFLGFVPEMGIGISIASNHGDAPTSQIGIYALSLLMGNNPDDSLEFVKKMKLREELKGDYTDFREYTIAKITDGPDGLLNMSFSSDEMEFSIPLILENDGIYTIMEDSRSPVTVKRQKNGKIEIHLERHRLVKK